MKNNLLVSSLGFIGIGLGLIGFSVLLYRLMISGSWLKIIGGILATIALILGLIDIFKKKKMKFEKWLKEYDAEYERELKEWQERSKIKLIPEDLDRILLQKYIAYRNEIATRKLIMATWFLAIATTILSIITLLISNF